MTTCGNTNENVNVYEASLPTFDFAHPLTPIMEAC